MAQGFGTTATYQFYSFVSPLARLIRLGRQAFHFLNTRPKLLAISR